MDYTGTSLGINASLRMTDPIVRHWNTFPPPSALLRPAGPWSGAGWCRNGRGRPGADRCARARSASGSAVASNPATRGSSGGADTVAAGHPDARRSIPAALALPAGPPAGAVRSRARSRRCAALRRFLRVPDGAPNAAGFSRVGCCCEGPLSLRGLGSVGVAGAPRVVPCDALLRRVRPRTPARLSGATSPQPPPLRAWRRTFTDLDVRCRRSRCANHNPD
jgi:hypothetical protein